MATTWTIKRVRVCQKPVLLFNKIEFHVTNETQKTLFDHIYQTPVENTELSGVSSTIFKVFGNVFKHCRECMIYLNKIVKIYANSDQILFPFV